MADFTDGSKSIDTVHRLAPVSVGRGVVSHATMAHERNEWASLPARHTPRSWAKLARNRIAWNHDEKNRFVGAHSGAGPFGYHDRAALWHAVY